ncbi:glutathione S-transferase family protein [Zhengella sp. ZM62]|uniref:glutathione S-transferase family protein n=1 Tax=Zhengella sedimenti TaxID=3390035 RepID=UPI0039771BFD
MLKLYGTLNSRASRVVWLALELGTEFVHVPVVQASRLAHPTGPDAPLNTASPAFRQICPMGTIPVIDDDGLVLAESLAINLYLARKARHSPVAPRNDDEDGLAVMWSLWAATMCEPHGVAILVNRVIRPPEERDDDALGTAIAAMEAPLRHLGEALETGEGYLVGKRFTVADLNAAEVLRYAQPAGALFDPHPGVSDWLSRCQSRPAFREMMSRRAAEPLPENWRDAYRPLRRETGS